MIQSNDITKYYYQHCYPEFEQIVRKVSLIRRSLTSDDLRHIYIMTNAVDPWLAQLKQALRLHERWESISSSRDLTLTREQREVSRALDMLIARRAQVFIGNGVCSSILFTSPHEIHLRAVFLAV